MFALTISAVAIALVLAIAWIVFAFADAVRDIKISGKAHGWWHDVGPL